MNLAEEYEAAETHRIRIIAADLAAQGQSHERIVTFVLQALKSLATTKATLDQAFKIAERASAEAASIFAGEERQGRNRKRDG